MAMRTAFHDASGNDKPGMILEDAQKTVAIDYLHAAEATGFDPAEAKALLRKLDLRLIPMLCFTYALQSIDRTTLSYAAVFGVREDLGLTGTQFSLASALLYIGASTCRVY
jgi:hypothetical protein